MLYSIFGRFKAFAFFLVSEWKEDDRDNPTTNERTRDENVCFGVKCFAFFCFVKLV